MIVVLSGTFGEQGVRLSEAVWVAALDIKPSIS